MNQLVKGLSKLTKFEMAAKLMELREVILMKVVEKIKAGLRYSHNPMEPQHIEDIQLDEEVRERIQRKVSDIEVCGAKTTLQEIGDDILNEVGKQLENKMENIKTDYLAGNLDNIVLFVAPVLGWSHTGEEESKTWLHKLGEDILKKAEREIKEKLEDIKDDLPTTVDQVVEGLVSRGWTWTGFSAACTQQENEQKQLFIATE